MEEPRSSESYDEDDLASEARGDEGEATLPAWPPPNPNPPPLPYAPDSGLSLSIDEAARAPEEPEFTPSRLDPVRKGADVREGERPAIVPFDPRNPSGRTRGDTVLRPTDEDRDARLRRHRLHAALYGVGLVFFLSIFMPDVTHLERAGFLGAGAGAGWFAHDLGDSELSWSGGMFLAAVACTWGLGPMHMAIYGGFFVAAGWLAGFTRDASLTA